MNGRNKRPSNSRFSSVPLSPRGRGVRGEGATAERTLDRAKELRHKLTEHERRMWSKLRNRRFAKYKFRRQVPLGIYIVDFVCFESRVIVELDGGLHNDVRRREYDNRRTKWLQKQGFRVLRYWNYQIIEDSDVVEDVILRQLEAGLGVSVPPSPPAPLPQGERGDTE